jgi:hypothetical protein
VLFFLIKWVKCAVFAYKVAYKAYKKCGVNGPRTEYPMWGKRCGHGVKCADMAYNAYNAYKWGKWSADMAYNAYNAKWGKWSADMAYNAYNAYKADNAYKWGKWSADGIPHVG